jgi:hypothetical protein
VEYWGGCTQEIGEMLAWVRQTHASATRTAVTKAALLLAQFRQHKLLRKRLHRPGPRRVHHVAVEVGVLAPTGSCLGGLTCGHSLRLRYPAACTPQGSGPSSARQCCCYDPPTPTHPGTAAGTATALLPWGCARAQGRA